MLGLCAEQGKKKKSSHFTLFGARIVPSLPLTPLPPHGWEERKSSSCSQYAFPEPGVLSPVSVAYPWTCRCFRIFQELVLVSHCKSSRAQEWFSPHGGAALALAQLLPSMVVPKDSHTTPGNPCSASLAVRWLGQEVPPTSCCLCCCVVPSLFPSRFVFWVFWVVVGFLGFFLERGDYFSLF